MARIRQQFPQNYGSSGNINTEFESVIRYINAAELGENTIGELLGKIFDAQGSWIGPVEFRKDSSSGIQYRVGTYTDSSAGWTTLMTLAELRGTPGSQAGEIGAPIFYGRADSVATSGQTDFDYSHESTDELLVYVDGILKQSGALNDYVSSATGGTGSAGVVTFNAGLTTGQNVTIFKVRATSITGYTRSDTTTTSSQINFPFTHDSNTKLQVYLNGLLQKEGGSYDYTTIPDQNTVQFNTAVTAGNTVTIITVENTSVQAVTGLMMEEAFADSATGLIKFEKLGIADGDITQAKVSGLVNGLNSKAKLTVSGNSPTGPASGDLWMDTADNPYQLKFYTGTQWLKTSPESSLPTFTTLDAGKYVKVNGTGTALEYGGQDLSSVIGVNQKGAASGVASLDSNGRLPASQLPSTLSRDSVYHTVATVANGTIHVKRVFRQAITIEALSLMTTSGTCSVQLQVDGTPYGDTYSVSTTPTEFVLGTPIQIDATTVSHSIGYVVTNNASASVLEVTMAISISST